MDHTPGVVLHCISLSIFRPLTDPGTAVSASPFLLLSSARLVGIAEFPVVNVPYHIGLPQGRVVGIQIASLSLAVGIDLVLEH